MDALPPTPRAPSETPTGGAGDSEGVESAECDVSEEASVCKDVVMTGPHRISVAAGARLHPHASVHASMGPIAIGASCGVMWSDVMGGGLPRAQPCGGFRGASPDTVCVDAYTNA